MSNVHSDPVMMAVAILNHNDGGPFVKEGIKRGLRGGLISPAKGLIGSALLNLLSIRHDRRDLVILFERHSILKPVLEDLVKRFRLDLPNHGILFVMPTRYGLRSDFGLGDNAWDQDQTPHQLLLMTFKHGRVKEVLDRLHRISKAGATIFTGKGEHQVEKQQVMGLSFSPQKDVILSVVPSDDVEEIFSSMEESFYCSQTKGMYIYSLDVHDFSQADQINPMPVTTDQMLLMSIISEDLEEAYIEKLKQLKVHGGTSLKAYGSVSPEMMERVFNITVNPQKKIMMTVDSTEKILQAYQTLMDSNTMQAQHQGVYLTIPLTYTYGLYRPE